MTANQLVLSPFVTARSIGGKQALICRDPSVRSNTAVIRSQIVDYIVDRFKNKQNPETFAANSQVYSREALASAIVQLLEAGILSDPEHFVPPNPTVELELTNHCNANCVMCPRKDLRPLGSMSMPVLRKVVNFIEATATGVIIQGIGEPTIHRNLVQAISAISAVLHAEGPVVLVTNGFCLDAELLKRVFDAGLSHVQWSFHSADQAKLARIMRNDRGAEYSRLNLIEALKRYADRLSVNVVLMDSNSSEIDDLGTWLRDHGLLPGRLRVIPVFSRGKSVVSSELLTETRIRRGAHCLYTRKSMFIAWDGRVLPCSNDIGGKHVIGNICTETPEVLMERWWNRLVKEQVSYGMCAVCDHASRDSLQTEWFSSVPLRSDSPANA